MVIKVNLPNIVIGKETNIKNLVIDADSKTVSFSIGDTKFENVEYNADEGCVLSGTEQYAITPDKELIVVTKEEKPQTTTKTPGPDYRYKGY